MPSDEAVKAAAIDVRYWKALYADSCPNCGVQWNDLPPEANIILHWYGDCKSERHSTPE